MYSTVTTVNCYCKLKSLLKGQILSVLTTHTHTHRLNCEVTDTLVSFSVVIISQYVFVLSCVQLFATPWTVAHQAPLSMVRILEWVAISYARPRDPTCVSYISCVGRQILYHWCYLGSPSQYTHNQNIKLYTLIYNSYCQ